VDTTLEVGPGRVLSGLVRRIDGDIEAHGASDAATIEGLALASQEGTA